MAQKKQPVQVEDVNVKQALYVILVVIMAIIGISFGGYISNIMGGF